MSVIENTKGIYKSKFGENSRLQKFKKDCIKL